MNTTIEQKPLFNKVTIVGVGLIGGSLGMDIRRKKIANEVVGVFRRQESINVAIKNGAVDKGELYLSEAIKDSDLIILSGPITLIKNNLKILAQLIKNSAIVIDVGSTKSEICSTAKEFFDTKRPPNANPFIGCHPMAGSEKQGVENAKMGLFEGATCFVMSPANKIIEEFWSRLGSVVLYSDPKIHDYMVARISHMPHILAFSMFSDLGAQVPLTNRSVVEFARLAKSDPQIWGEIFVSNKAEISKSIDVMINNLTEWKKAIENKDLVKINDMIVQANNISYRISFKDAE